MAFAVPVPRSFNQALGDIIDTFRARIGIANLQVGGVILTGFEASAQSDIRSTQDVFNLLDLSDLDRVSESALDFVGRDENLPRLGANTARGFIDIFDSSIAKIYSRIYSGMAAPVAGSTLIRIADGASFPSTGRIYIGRGTVGIEGPLTYTSKTQIGQYWQLVLSVPTVNFHNINEEVVLAQGGDRTIANSATVSPAPNALSNPVLFQTTQAATIEDGENVVRNVPIVCTTPGPVGNVPPNSITVFNTLPFSGAYCSNAKPIQNGDSVEGDPSYRARIRNTRASRSRGTDLAILTAVKGVFSSEENKRVNSASLINRVNQPSVLYIDDGSGYEEQTSAIAYEVLTDSASGGETDFAISGQRPIAKAFVKTTLTAPFSLSSGSVLAVKVGGALYQHTFNTAEFTAISSATAQEIVSSINSDSSIQFSARTANGGTRISLFARSETNEDLEVVVPAGSVNANDAFGFPSTPSYTLKLYKNDRLLYKDGRTAVLSSAPQSLWSPMASGVTLSINVDGTGFVTYTFSDIDFVTAGTSYSTLSSTNSLASWVAVLQAKIPGISVTDAGGFLLMTSNLGTSSRASLIINPIGGDLVAAGMFTTGLGLSSSGLNLDYSLDRNRAQVTLQTPLLSGDTLTVGSPNTRAYVQSVALVSGSVVTTATARLWVAIDATPTRLFPPFNAATVWAQTGAASAAEAQTTFQVTGITLTSYLQAGDYVIMWDPSFKVHGAFVINTVVGDTFDVAIPHTVDTSYTLSSNGVAFFRLRQGTIQEIRLTPATRTLGTLVADLNALLDGATASQSRGQYLRITTNNFSTDGDVTVLTADIQGQLLGLPLGTTASASPAHRAFAQSRAETVAPLVTSTGLILSDLTGLKTDDSTVGPLQSTSGQPVSNHGVLLVPVCHLLANAPLSGHTSVYGNNIGKHYSQYSNSDSVTQYRPRTIYAPVAITSLVRNTNVTTVTTAAVHNLATGDIVFVGNTNNTPDANFPDGFAANITVTSTTTFTYPNTGANATAATPYSMSYYDGWSYDTTSDNTSSHLISSPFLITPRDNLSIVMDNDFLGSSYNVPMARTVNSTSTTFSFSPINVVDADNGNVPLSQAFGTSDVDYFRDFFAFMRARTISNKNSANAAILWRAARFGPECNNWSIAYTYPTGPSTPLSYTASLDTTGKFNIEIAFAGGAARAGTNILPQTLFNVSATPLGPSDMVVISQSTPIIAIGQLSRAAGVVTANTTGNHGYVNGQTVYLTSTDVNFPGGAKVITVVDPDTFTYVEAGVVVASTVATSVSSTATPVDFSVLVLGVPGDVVNIATSAGGILPIGRWRPVAKTATSFSILIPPGTGVSSTTPLSVGAVSNLTFYEVNSVTNTATAIAAFANANMASLVTAKVLGTGATVIAQATQEQYLGSIPNRVTSPFSVERYTMSCGLNWVRSSNLGISPNTISFKTGPSDTDLATGCDFDNEIIKLVPNTTAALKRWFSSSAVTGVSALAEVSIVDRDSKLQISSRNLGQAGGVLISGGAANISTTSILGTQELTNLGLIQVTAGTDLQFSNGLVALENTLPTPLTPALTSANTIRLYANGDITFNTTISNFTTYNATGATNVTRIGDFCVYDLRDASVTLVGNLTGRWIKINGWDGNPLNAGQFRIVYNTATSFVIENSSGISEQHLTAWSVNVFDQNAVVPGSSITIGWSLGSASNVGTYEVTATTTTTLSTNANFVPVGPIALGTDLGNLAISEPTFRIIAGITGIAPNPSNVAQSTIVVGNPAIPSGVISRLSPSLGATITSIDKLGFPVTPAQGANGYAVNTGLLAEVIRVLYGDLNAPTIYPGIVANGAHVNGSGPNLKRIKISLQMRPRIGAPLQNVQDRIRAAIVTEVASIPLGQDVDISRLLAVARKVEGVASIVPLSPTYDASNEFISVQANEKPTIFDLINDIAITVAT